MTPPGWARPSPAGYAAAFEIAEYNPHRDIQGRTVEAMRDILMAVLRAPAPVDALLR
jgi:arginase family enzyme